MRYYLAIIISMLIWGSVGIFTRHANQPSQVIVFFRVLSASLVLAPFVIMERKKREDKELKNLPLLILSGIFLSLNWLFFFKAIQTTTIAKATLSYYTAPVMVTIFSPLLLKEKLEKKTIVSIMLAFFGVSFIVLFPLSNITSGGYSGILFGLIAAFFYSLVTITAKYLSGIGPISLAFYQTLVSAVVFAPFVLGEANLSPGSLVTMAAIGVFHTALTLTLYFYGIGRVKVQHAGVLSYLDPLSAVVFGMLFLGEVPTSATIAGGVLILAASLIIIR